MARKKSDKQVTNKIEQTVSTILSRLNLPFKEQVVVDKYTVDFLVDNKYIVECFGDFWHCNPQQYTSSYYNKGKKKTAEEIWKRDKERKETFEQLGYKVVRLDRVMFAGLTKKDLPRSKWRLLTDKELNFLRMLFELQ